MPDKAASVGCELTLRLAVSKEESVRFTAVSLLPGLVFIRLLKPFLFYFRVRSSVLFAKPDPGLDALGRVRWSWNFLSLRMPMT